MGNARNHSRRVWGNGCVPLGTPVPPGPNAVLAGLVALTGGQRLVVAIILAVFVLDVFVWPVIKGQNRSPSHIEHRQSHARLMREVAEHDNVD